MKKYWWILCVVMLLTGCGAAETFETISDEMMEPVAAVQREFDLEMPEDAVMTVMESNAGTLYLCEGYEISQQVFEAGDLDRTVQNVCGYQRDDLTLLETQSEGAIRYDFVWSTAGESGDQIGRAAILDDGSYHYVLSVMADAEQAGQLEPVWNELFDTFVLG